MSFRVRRTILTLLVAAPIVAAALLWNRPPALLDAYPRRNILLISVDTLRPDHLGSYGYHRPTSPTIDALSQRAVTFDLAFAPRGMTWPSLATMLTSLSPATTNLRWNGQYLPVGTPTIAGLLKDSGYKAGAFVSGSICHLARQIGDFDKVACGEDTYVASRAVAFIRSLTGEPFFAWLHLLAPHGPYDPPPEYDLFSAADYQGPVGRDSTTLATLIRGQRPLTDADSAQLNGLYDGEVLFADAQVALLLKTLEEQGLRDDTIVVFTADHGEDLHDHNGYLYHSCSIYDSVLRIPMMLALPDGAAAGERVSSIVEMADLAPTLLELVGVERPPTLEGRSMLAHLDGRESSPPGSAAGERVASSEWYDPKLLKSLQTVRTERWRYVSNPEGLTPRCPPAGDYYKVAREELYDHAADPREQHNVAAEHPELTRRFAKLTEAGHAAASDASPLPVDEKLREELRSFGYVE